MPNHQVSSQPTLDSFVKPAERRAHVRYPCSVRTSCQSPSSELDKTSWLAWARDISTGGMGLILRHRFEQGTELEVELQNAVDLFSEPLLIRVMHSTVQPDGTYLVGCSFVHPLSENELKARL